MRRETEIEMGTPWASTQGPHLPRPFPPLVVSGPSYQLSLPPAGFPSSPRMTMGAHFSGSGNTDEICISLDWELLGGKLYLSLFYIC